MNLKAALIPLLDVPHVSDCLWLRVEFVDNFSSRMQVQLRVLRRKRTTRTINRILTGSVDES